MNLILKNILTQPILWAGVIPMHLFGIYAIYNVFSAPSWGWAAFIV